MIYCRVNPLTNTHWDVTLNIFHGKILIHSFTIIYFNKKSSPVWTHSQREAEGGEGKEEGEGGEGKEEGEGCTADVEVSHSWGNGGLSCAGSCGMRTQGNVNITQTHSHSHNRIHTHMITYAQLREQTWAMGMRPSSPHFKFQLDCTEKSLSLLPIVPWLRLFFSYLHFRR